VELELREATVVSEILAPAVSAGTSATLKTRWPVIVETTAETPVGGATPSSVSESPSVKVSRESSVS